VTDIGRGIITVALFLVVLGGLVLIHELGHFFAARLFRVRVLEFGIGFPPRARVLRAGGETLWTLNWLPIGGFVRLEGEDGGSVGDPHSFSAQRLPIQLLILVAGVAMNALLAFVLFVAIAWQASPIVGVRVPSVQANSPASSAGIVSGDVIVSLNGRGYDLYSEGILPAIRNDEGQAVTLGIRHADGTTTSVPVTLRGPAEVDADHGPLGVTSTTDHPFESVFLDQYASRPLDQAIGIGATEVSRGSGLIVGGLGDIASGFIRDPTAAPPASGPVGIAVQIGDVFFGAGWIMTLYVVALLSVNLAVVNILPFPPLDGGRMFVLILKRLLGPRVSARAERLTYVVGFLFLFAFIIWVTSFDIARQFGGSP
jgi:regulator of sigma E protease